MRILILGGNGLVGSAVAERLGAAGHEVLLASRYRSGNGYRLLDLTRLDTPAIEEAIDGVDVIVNCAGIFSEEGEQSFDAIHVKGPAALYEAASAANVRCIIQISALGADAASPLGYFASKGKSDERLLGMNLSAWVVRPSLVYSQQGRSTRFFARLAALPVTPLPGGGEQRIQPLSLHDLAEAVVRLAVEANGGGILNAVGPRSLSLREYLSLFKSSLGMAQRFVGVPDWAARAWVRLGPKRPGQLLDEDSLEMLEAGNTASASSLTRLLGRAPTDPAIFVSALDRHAILDARLAWLLPLMRWAIAIMWIVTGWVSIFVYPLESSLDLLKRVGLEGTFAYLALYGAAVLDAVLGVALLLARQRRRIYFLQLALIAAYTVLISLFLPEYWAHPYGPVLKNLPLLAMILCLSYLDTEHGPDPR
jgi:uncharacterized protein YbjT (DUF2867 family)